MTVRSHSSAINLRAIVARLAGLEHRQAEHPDPLAFVGDGTTTAFALPRGYRPGRVFKDGIMQRKGPFDAYTVTLDGFAYRVLFAVAPAAAARVDIEIWRAK